VPLRLLVIVVVACGSKTATPPPAVVVTPPPPPPTFVDSSPGPLSASHQTLDAQRGCNECHDGGKEVISAKCLACHEHGGLRASIHAGRGFHASAVVKGRACNLCHLEHRGRAFDVMGWESVVGGQPAFNHTLTGWPLTGKHAGPTCEACHTARNRQGLTTFVGTNRACVACHAKVQPHGLDPRRPIAACERCHAEVAWKPARQIIKFDHNDRQDASWPLDKDHATVACANCHPNALFDLPATTFACVDCHPKGPPKPKRR